MKFDFRGVIKGSYCSMKNQRRPVQIGGRPALIKKQKALDWEAAAVYQVKRPVAPYGGEVALIADFYYDHPRADLDENLLCDVLQQHDRRWPNQPRLGVIVNDSQIKAHDTRWHLDKDNPRVVFRLVDMDTYNKGVL